MRSRIRPSQICRNALLAALFGVVSVLGLLSPAGAAAAPTSPIGSFDVATNIGYFKLHVAGWTVDPARPDMSTTAAVYVDNRGFAFTANRSRPDVQRTFHYPISAYGFDGTIDINPGTHHVCAYAISISGHPNALIACRTITVSGTPIGHVDQVTTGLLNGYPLTRVSGWAFDPDLFGGPETIVVVIYNEIGFNGGLPVPSETTTDIYRPDVGRVFGLSDSNVGFSVDISTVHGFGGLRIYAANLYGTGSNTLIYQSGSAIAPETPRE